MNFVSRIMFISSILFYHKVLTEGLKGFASTDRTPHSSISVSFAQDSHLCLNCVRESALLKNTERSLLEHTGKEKTTD